MKPAWTCALHHAADIPRSKRKRDLCEDCYDGLVVRGLAWCPRGKHRVEASAISPVQGAPCRSCVNAARRAKSNPAQNSARARSWRERNPEKIRAYRNRPDVRARNVASHLRARKRRPEHYRAKWRAQYYKYAEERRERQRQYRRRHHDQVLARYRKYREQRKIAFWNSWRYTA